MTNISLSQTRCRICNANILVYVVLFAVILSVLNYPNHPIYLCYNTVSVRHHVARVCQRQRRLFKQGVVLTERKTTDPPSHAAPGELRCICAMLQTTTDTGDRY